MAEIGGLGQAGGAGGVDEEGAILQRYAGARLLAGGLVGRGDECGREIVGCRSLKLAALFARNGPPDHFVCHLQSKMTDRS